MSPLRSLLILLVLAFPSVPLRSADPPREKGTPQDARIAELLEPIRTKHDVPALAATVVSPKGTFTAAVGVRKKGSPVPVTPDDRFHLGSDTKAMTATLIARLVESGKLRWDTPLEKLFPALAPKMDPALRQATLVHLLTHDAGLPDFENGVWWELSRTGSLREQRAAAARRALEGEVEAQPGKRHKYANINHVVAAAAVERLMGQSWEDLMTRQLFQPLGMKTAGFGPMHADGKLTQPWPHTEEGTPIPPTGRTAADNPGILGPAGRVHCSLPDWGRFAADLIQGARGERALLLPASYRKLLETPFSNYAIGGWGRIKLGEEYALTHNGSNTLNYATAWVSPQQGLAVLVATNQGGAPGRKACQEAREALLQAFPAAPGDR